MKARTRSALVVLGVVLATVAPVAGTIALGQGKDVGQNVAFDKTNGPEVVFGETAEITNENPYANANKIVLDPWGEFQSSGSTSVRVDRFNGSWTNVSSLDVVSTELAIDINDKQRVAVEGQTKSLKFTDMGVDDGNADFVFDGVSGSTTLTIYGLPANTKVVAEDRTTQQVIASNTTDGSGVLVLQMSNSKHKVHLVSSAGSASPSLSNGRPTGTLNQIPTKLKVDVSDADYPYESVDVQFDLDGTDVGTDTLSSSGTAEVDISSVSLSGGSHTVDVTATDSYGNTDSLSYTFTAPDTLEIYNESAPTQQITSTNVEVEFFYNDGQRFRSVTKTATSGSVGFGGLPVNRPMVIKANSDGWNSRRIFLPGLFNQSKIYLLNDSMQSTTVRFNLQDFSGDFPQETTVLEVRRPIDNGNYTTIVGDFFGATKSFPADLAYNERHRLRLRNTETGETRELGKFTPLSSGEQELAVSVSGEIRPVDSQANVDVSPTAELLPDSVVTLEVDVDGGASGVQTAEIEMIKETSSGSTTVFRDTRSSNGTVSAAVNLSDAESLEVRSNVTTNNGGQFVRSKEFGIVEYDSSGPTIIGSLTSLSGLLPTSSRAPFEVALALSISLMGVAGAASRFRLSSEVLGLVGLLFIAGFGVLGFIGYDILVVGIISYVSLLFLGRRL